jgi:hypothetical protein
VFLQKRRQEAELQGKAAENEALLESCSELQARVARLEEATGVSTDILEDLERTKEGLQAALEACTAEVGFLTRQLIAPALCCCAVDHQHTRQPDKCAAWAGIKAEHACVCTSCLLCMRLSMTSLTMTTAPVTWEWLARLHQPTTLAVARSGGHVMATRFAAETAEVGA